MDLAELIKQNEGQGAASRRRRLRPRTRRIRPARPAATDAVRFARMIHGLTEGMRKAIKADLFPALLNLEPEYIVGDSVTDDYGDQLSEILDRIRRDHLELTGRHAQLIGEGMTKQLDERNRERFYAAIEDVIGINVAGLVDEGNLAPVLKLKTRENVNLIKSIPEEFLGKVETVVYESVIQGRTSAKSLMQEIQEIGEVSKRRAKFIARDQTAKLNAALNRERNQALGITEYIWQTSKDERVRKSHFEKRGKTFRWDNPPADTGHPGEDYQCRCNARPVIVI